jgi:putative transposase
VLFVIHHATRAVHIAGVTPPPNSAFMAQVARNLTGNVDGFLRDMQFLVVDNDVLFTKQFCSILADPGVDVTRTAIQAPNMNAFAERWAQTVKRECLSKLILFSAGHLRHALSELTAHYHEQRPHQGLDSILIDPANDEPPNGRGR